MRITEFVSAADALAMWKVISDNTWAAIAQQEEAESRARAERAAARKSASKRGVGKKSARPIQPKRLPPPLQHVTAPVAKDAKPAASAAQKTPKPQQQQPVQNPAAMPAVKAVQPIQPKPVGAIATQAIPNQANLASQTQFVRSTNN